jgi:hypothetical protein
MQNGIAAICLTAFVSVSALLQPSPVMMRRAIPVAAAKTSMAWPDGSL